MTEKLKTCRQCEHLDELTMAPGFKAFGCKKTGFMVPHHSGSEEKSATFWRIPLDCPRPDAEVEKRKEKQPTKHWETLDWADA